MTIPSHGEEHVHAWLGLYVLDALAPDESAAVETHLAACAACRTEASEHGKVREFLDLLTFADVDALPTERVADDALAPEPTAARRVIEPAREPVPTSVAPSPVPGRAHTRGGSTAPATGTRPASSTGPAGRPAPRRRPAHPYRLILSAFTLALVIGVGIGVGIKANSPVGITLAGSETNTVTGVSMSVTVIGTNQGSHVDAEVKGLKPDVTYQLDAVSSRGDSRVVARWVAAGPIQRTAGDIAIRAEDLAFVTVTQVDGSVLITVRVTRSSGGRSDGSGDP